MARCEEGYRCDICNREVEQIADSDLYLRYILGELPLEALHQSPERHIRCNPTLAQFIVDPAFGTVICPEPFSKLGLDPSSVAEEEARVTCAWLRLQEVTRLGLAIPDYPLRRFNTAQDHPQ